MESSRDIGGGNIAVCREQILVGSHPAAWSRSFARSVHTTEKKQNMGGHCDPPKVSLIVMRAKFSKRIMHRAAVSPGLGPIKLIFEAHFLFY
jgi:hypothetical protein